MEGVIRNNETDRNSGSDRLNTSQINPDSLSHPRIFRDKVEKGGTGLTFDRVTYMFCCRADSPSASIAITGFPSNTGPFYLYRYVFVPYNNQQTDQFSATLTSLYWSHSSNTFTHWYAHLILSETLCWSYSSWALLSFNVNINNSAWFTI